MNEIDLASLKSPGADRTSFHSSRFCKKYLLKDIVQAFVLSLKLRLEIFISQRKLYSKMYVDPAQKKSMGLLDLNLPASKLLQPLAK